MVPQRAPRPEHLVAHVTVELLVVPVLLALVPPQARDVEPGRAVPALPLAVAASL